MAASIWYRVVTVWRYDLYFESKVGLSSDKPALYADFLSLKILDSILWYKIYFLKIIVTEVNCFFGLLSVGWTEEKKVSYSKENILRGTVQYSTVQYSKKCTI